MSYTNLILNNTIKHTRLMLGRSAGDPTVSYLRARREGARQQTFAAKACRCIKPVSRTSPGVSGSRSFYVRHHPRAVSTCVAVE